MQEAMRVEDGSVRFPDIAAQTTSADTYRHPGLQLSRSKTTLIEPDQKIAQGVFVKIERPDLYEIREDNIYGQKTNRGSGALGSTGNF